VKIILKNNNLIFLYEKYLKKQAETNKNKNIL
jgi:hypothetical protein